MAQTGKRERENHILQYLGVQNHKALKYLGVKNPDMHSFDCLGEEKTLFNRLSVGTEHPKIYAYHLRTC